MGLIRIGDDSPPSKRYNVDQVPLPFVINLKNTMEESGKKWFGFAITMLDSTKGFVPCNFAFVKPGTSRNQQLFLEVKEKNICCGKSKLG